MTEALTLATAAVVLATAVVTAAVTFRTRKDVQQVHVLVNSKMTEALARIEQLKGALVAADTQVPEDPHA